MGFSRSRKTALTVATSALLFNILSSLLVSQLPDDRFHLAVRFGWYLHFISVACIFGIIGALRHHALSISLFANFLLVDTLLTTLPRIVLPILLPSMSTLCAAPLYAPQSFSSTQDFQHFVTPPQLASASTSSSISDFAKAPTLQKRLEDIAATWTPEGCDTIVRLGQTTLAAMVVAAMVLQVLGALRVKMYARRLGNEEMAKSSALASLELGDQVEKAV